MYSICILILILDMFCAGFPGRVYCLTAYSLSCRGRFGDTGSIWNMLLIIYMILIMFRFVWKNHFVTYKSIFNIYVTLCKNLLWQWCLKSTTARLLSTHLFPPNRYICFNFFGSSSFSFQVVYMSLIHYLIWNWHIYMLLYMQAPTEAPVLEEHQTGGPPFMSQQVCLCRSLSLYVCVHISRSSNIQYVS